MLVSDDGEWLVPILRGNRFSSEEEAEAYLLAHNKIGEGLWDGAEIAAVLQSLKDHELSFEGTGFMDIDLERMIADDPEQRGDWRGMPEFVQEDKEAERQIVVNFRSDEDAQKFGEVIGQRISDRTRSIWFPEAEREPAASKRYHGAP